MIRRQWVEHERLTFPLVYLPLELTRGELSRSLVRSRAFWVAFTLACLFRSISGIHRVVPSAPDLAGFTFKGQQISLEPYLVDPPWDAVGFFKISFHPMIVGITYFLPLDVAFRSWWQHSAGSRQVGRSTPTLRTPASRVRAHFWVSPCWRCGVAGDT
jgi:hypothetical protein